MKNIRKANSIFFAVVTVAMTIWFASLAIRNYCSWGFNGFLGYTVLMYVFMTVVFVFADGAMSEEQDDFEETL